MSDGAPRPGLHFGAGFAVFAWALVVGGAAYLGAGLLGLVRGREPAWALMVIGLVALGAGACLIRWTRRAGSA